MKNESFAVGFGVILAFSFMACNTGTNGNLKFDVPTTGVQVWNYTDEAPYTGSATVKLGYGNGTETRQYLTLGNVTGGIMTIDFTPVSTIDWEAIPCSEGNSVSGVFAEPPGFATALPSGVKMGKDASLELFNGESSIGYLYFFNYSEEYSMGHLCVDQAVTITGTSTYDIEGSTPYTVDIHAESGFNFFLIDRTTETLTTEYENLPADMKWWVY
ncbi:MAG: hypothetical protein LBQ46_04015 [Treponema sp.]|jgi:hypothetical protein|nr:hypothetical protein [Treponema sp.]